VVLAQGDTTTALAAALAAFHRGIAFAHIEAGLRTARRDAPFPEEMNRRLIGRLAELHFAPTSGAADNLRREGIPAGDVFTTGNPVVDALEWTLKKHCPPPLVPLGKRLLLVTVHRRENHGPRLDEICRAVGELSRRDDVHIVWPVHPNPAVGQRVQENLSASDSVRFVPPLAYPEFIAAMKAACVVLSDSGGVQEEALALGTPLLVLRDETERGEAVACGGAALVGADRGRIVRAASQLLDEPAAYAAMAQVRFPFGAGDAATRIVCCLRDRFAASAAVQGWSAEHRRQTHDAAAWDERRTQQERRPAELALSR
jgi:UDP-N-acetylglucosamine 2-epimerase (non-hydrolysing)